ncbi:MAG: pyrimidine 5'-nucleotidase, partial [Parvularcula sp.]|nr:pyrimidine 5'-nucleotidase [Parvularcula sp.]
MSAALKLSFENVTDWVFDLDNTLYPAGCNLFAEIDTRMTEFVCEILSCNWDEGRRQQKALYVSHGTTLAGLMAMHDVDPRAFMDYVHAIDLQVLRPDPQLREALTDLPGRKFVHTNGSVRHAENVLA